MALTLLATNNAESALASAISETDTSLIVSAGTGAEFPDAVAGESYFKLTLTDAATGSQVEIVNVTSKTGDIFTIERAQEGTLARAWAANDMVANMMTADTLNVIADYSKQAADSAEEAKGYALSASEFGDNKFTFYKTSSDPDGTIAGLAATTNGQSFRVAQGVDGTDAFITYQNDNGVAVAQAAQPGTAAITGTVREYSTLSLAENDVAAGNILDGSKCWVANPSDITLADEYINNAGSLVATGRKMPSQAAVDEISDRIPYVPSPNYKVPLFVDDDDNVPVWLANGKLNASALDEDIRDVSDTDYPDKIPLFVDDDDNVPVWLANGKLNASALDEDIRDVSDTDYPDKIPLFVDDDDNVPVWLANGKLNASALDEDIRDVSDTDYPDKIPLFVDDDDNVPVWLENGELNAVAINKGLLQGLVTNDELNQVFLQKTLNTSGSTAWKFRSKKAKLDIGLSSKLKIGFTGDSWTEHSTIPQVFADYFYAKYGKSGDGWIQLNIDNPNQLNGIVLARDGWSVYDASATSANPPFPTAMDGQYIYATGTAATLSISNLFDTSVQIFYYDGTGTFRYSVNGGTPVVITGAGTNKIVSVTVSGLNIATATTLSIDLTGNTGTVVIYGFYANGTGNGVEINKMGNGGITAPQYIKTLSYLSQTGTVVAPDVLIMIIGTNDFRTSVTLQAFRDGLTWWLNAWKSIVPDSAIILVAPAQCNASGANPLASFRDIMRDVAITAGVEFYSLYDFMNTTYAKSNAEGMWLDNLHLSNAGGRFLLNQINAHFLEQ
ncbi:GDSL-like Lipase/Acylhydrolase family protein [Klebsiella oxytoca]|uniref:SGNH/GDSL hydrolase family protein n=1 Tax=Klebsiella oxytoca TaxID=571 RepID=UPI000D525ABA|nr:GDSL-type esterase/lipase family protein [Klebsiella oxytoca]AWF35955.1 GDSL-like Lipase/Acylhydrolase family protein [Klebsiella oxytoca]